VSKEKNAAGSEQVKTEASQQTSPESSGRKPRRRRSPYQTAGVKPRDGQTQESANKGQPDSAPNKVNEPSSSPAALPAPKQVQAEVREDAPPAPKPSQAPTAESKPTAEAPVKVIKDQNGIYTLKPAQSEASGRESSGTTE